MTALYRITHRPGVRHRRAPRKYRRPQSTAMRQVRQHGRCLCSVPYRCDFFSRDVFMVIYWAILSAEWANEQAGSAAGEELTKNSTRVPTTPSVLILMMRDRFAIRCGYKCGNILDHLYLRQYLSYLWISIVLFGYEYLDTTTLKITLNSKRFWCVYYSYAE